MNTITDGSILKMLGIALSRDAHGVATPAKTSHVLFRRFSWCGSSQGTKECDDARLAGYFTDTICPACHQKVSRDLDRRAA